jgi:hypothetical protein
MARYLLAMRLLRLALCLALLAAPASGWAQQTVLVVPPGAQVVVPARGAPPPRTLPPAPARAEAPRPPEPTVLAPGAVGLAPVAGVLLPLAAAALLGGTLAGSGGGSAAPARTR